MLRVKFKCNLRLLIVSSLSMILSPGVDNKLTHWIIYILLNSLIKISLVSIALTPYVLLMVFYLLFSKIITLSIINECAY